MTVDVDVYDSEGEKVDIDILPGIKYFSIISSLSSRLRKLHYKNQYKEDGGERQIFPDPEHQRPPGFSECPGMCYSYTEPRGELYHDLKVAKRLDLLNRRGRAPIIYHQVSANKSYSVLFMDMRVYTRDEGEYEDKAIDPPK